MRYYTIQNDSILIAENESALTRFYNNVLSLPNDYEEGKYVVKDGELVLNPNWEEEKAKEIKQNTINKIKQELCDLDLKRIRAVCENEIKDESTKESWLEFYNKQISELREKLSSI